MNFCLFVPRKPFVSALLDGSRTLSSLGRFHIKSGHRLFFSVVGVTGLSCIVAKLYLSSRNKAYCRDSSVSINNTGRFAGKVVLITGAAGDIGGAAADRFAREGALVVLSDLKQAEGKLLEKCHQLKGHGATPIVLPADVTNEEDVKNMVDRIIRDVGRIDVLFNNAGIQGDLFPLHKQDNQRFKKVTEVNIYGVFLCLKYVSQAMINKGTGGVIVNSASVAGIQGPANMVAYAASKFAVVGMTKTASKDLAPYGIRVNAIAPGILEGRLWGTQVEGNARCRKLAAGDNSEVTAKDIQEQEERMINGTPLKRLGQLEEVASVVTFLSSDDSSYLSGVTLPVDGGRIP